MGVGTVRHHDVADLARVGARLHGVKAVGEIRRTYSCKIRVGLVQGGIRKIVVGAGDGAELERHGLLSVQSVLPSSCFIERSGIGALMNQCDVRMIVEWRY